MARYGCTSTQQSKPYRLKALCRGPFGKTGTCAASRQPIEEWRPRDFNRIEARRPHLPTNRLDAVVFVKANGVDSRHTKSTECGLDRTAELGRSSYAVAK